MRHHILLTHDDVKERGTQSHVVSLIEMIDEYILKILKFGRHMSVVGSEIRNLELTVQIPLEKLLDISEDHIILVVHMPLHFLDIVVEKLHKEERDIVRLLVVDSLDQMMPDPWEQHVYE